MSSVTSATSTFSRFLRIPLLAAALLLACDVAPFVDDRDVEAEVVEPEADALPSSLASRVATYVGQYGRHWPTFRFHGVVLVARGDQVAVHQSFGDADLIEGVPNETTTVFRLGTLSAQFTAAAVMRLVEAGALRLDDPVSRHIANWPGGDSITIEQLLSHRSGIASYTEGLPFELWKRGPRELASTLELFRELPLEFEAGTDTAPSNSNYVLLGAILEAASGKPYPQVVREQVLEPLGMSHTYYATTDEAQAIGMTYNEGEYLEVVTRVHPSAFGPAGGWLSTSGDLLRWVQGLRHGELLTKRHVNRMQGRLDEGMGYAWATTEAAGRTVSSWPGLIDGFNSALLHNPEDDTTILVLSNSEVVPAGQLAFDIATLVYEDELPLRDEPRSVPVDMAEQLPAQGRYLLTRGTEEALVEADPQAAAKLREVFVRAGDDHLLFEVPGHGRKRMHPLGKGRFFFKDGAQTQAQVITRADHSAILVLEASGVELRFIRVAEAQARRRSR